MSWDINVLYTSNLGMHEYENRRFNIALGLFSMWNDKQIYYIYNLFDN